MVLLVFFVMALAVVVLIYMSALLVRVGQRLSGRGAGRLWGRTHRLALILLPVLFLVIGPMVMGLYGSRGIGTRRDERAYAGPRLDAGGTWMIQDKRDLVVGTAPSRYTVSFESTDGLRLRGFHVPAKTETKFVAVVVHGLFRGALEIERVGSMLRDLGGDVLLLEMRNHGSSGRAPATYGLDESRDVVAAVAWLRREVPDKPLLIFGVSLGTAAIALALPDIEDLSALVLDSPLADLATAADRNLNLIAKPGRRAIAIPQPWRMTVIACLEMFSGFSMSEVRPAESLRAISGTIHALVVGGDEDIKMPPSVLRSVFDALPCEHKELWLRRGSDHGRVWIDDSQGYRKRLARLVASMPGY